MLGMDQMYKMALDPRIFPDQRLLAIMQGKDQSLPMAVAMAAKQQRDKLHQAAQGQQAQQGAKQPTVKDQMLAKDLPAEYAEHAGLAALPAENMQGMGEEKMMAGGGIVAFKDTGLVPSPEGDIDPNTYENKSIPSGRKFDQALLDKIKSIPGSVGSWLQEQNKPWSQIAAQTNPADAQAAMTGNIPKGTLPAPAPSQPNLPPTINSTPTQADLAAGVAPAGTITPEEQAVINAKNANNPIKKPGQAPAPAQPNPMQDSGIAAAYKDFMNRPDPFAGLGDTDKQHADKIAEAKNQGLSGMLMSMGARIMQHVGPLGAAGGEGLEAGLPSLQNSYKVVRELDNNREQFQFNKAKAAELRAQGNIEAAIKYEQANTDLMYKTGSLAVEHEKNAMMAPYYGAMASYAASGKGKNANELSLDQAAKDFNAIKDPAMKRQLAALGVTDALKYRQYMNTGVPPLTVTGTIPQGAPTLQLPS